jgi:DNA-directed RNA polymerase subunit RPC12/RpoP
MGMIPIRCGACGKASQIDQAWLGRQVACPHCRAAMLAEAASPAKSAPVGSPTPPPPPSSPPVDRAAAPSTFTARVAPPAPPAPPATAAPAPPRPLTRAQRDAIRRRRHVVLAVGAALALAGMAAALLALS